MILLGIFTAFKVPVALFPNIEFPRIVVNVDSSTKPVSQMVVTVTKPIEQALQTVPNIVSLRSTSSHGSADFSINFNWGINMLTALLQVEAAMNRVLPSLPPGTNFTATRLTPSIMPMMGFSLTSSTLNLVDLSNIANNQIKPMLVTIPGIEKVDIVGSRTAEYQVLVNPDRLRGYGLTFDDVIKALNSNNIVTTVGKIEDHYRLYLVEVNSQFQTSQALEDTVIRVINNRVIKLNDIATVTLGEVPEWNRVTADGRNAVLINIRQQPIANTIAIANEVTQKLNEFIATMPKTFQIKSYYDQSKIVSDSALRVRDAIIIGAILAGLVLLLFLRDLRMTFIVAIVLPSVLCITILFLHALNITFNIMSLGGMAAAVGLIIDDGIVLLEYIIRRLKEINDAAGHVHIYSLASEMLRPLAGSSLATIIIFFPLAFISGVTGGFFKVLALTMASALTISFFVVLILVPILSKLLIGPRAISRFIARKDLLEFAYPYYEKYITLFCNKPRWLLLLAVVVITLGGIAYTQVGTGFIPKIDEGGFVLDYIAPPGTSLTETNRLLLQVEKIITSNPYVDTYTRRTGLQLGGGMITETNTGDFFIHLKPFPRPDINTIMTNLRDQITQRVPGLHIETLQLMEDVIGDLAAVPQPIEVKIFTNDPQLATNTAHIIAAKLSEIPGIVEINDGIVITGDALQIHVDPIKAVLSGVDVAAVTQQIQQQIDGQITGAIANFDKPIAIRVKANTQITNQSQALNSLMLTAADGNIFPLSRIATLTTVSGQAQITRENLRNMIAVTARIDNRDLGSTMKDVKAVIKQLKLPAGVNIEYGGIYQQQQQSFHDLIFLICSAILLVTFLLLFLYERISIVLSILTTTLLSISGVFIGLWLTDTELNISSMMGLTMIIGIATEIAIFYFAEVAFSETKHIEMLTKAGVLRMRPIIMTSLVAILALFPLAIGIGGKSIESPLAIAIIAGLILAVPLVLIFMPCFYYFLNKRLR